MKQIEAREFKERSRDYLTGNEPLAIVASPPTISVDASPSCGCRGRTA